MRLTYFNFLVFALALMFSACNPDPAELDEITDPNTSITDGDEDDKDDDDKDDDDWKDGKEDCFEFVYPISFTMPDGTTISGDEDELEEAIKDWYVSNEDSEEKPSLVYPVEIIIEDKDEVITINEEEEFAKIKEACEKEEDDWDDEKKDCFKFVYPLSYTMPDGSTISGEEEDLKNAIKDWYISNEDSEEKPSLVYPVEIILEDRDEIIIVNNEEEFAAIKKACDDDSDDDSDDDEDDNDEDDNYKDCFRFIYPVSYVMPDGTTITGGNEEELWTAIKHWYLANDDVDREPQLVFPVEIVFEDTDEIIIVSNEEEMDRIHEACEDDEDDEDDEFDCEEIRANIGDPCTTDGGIDGTVNEDCECV